MENNILVHGIESEYEGGMDGLGENGASGHREVNPPPHCI